ncbi:MAG: flagellar M-ring protein FliF C-terminal domain-containing protein, partial [Hyphomicrobiales bacterium]
NPEQIEQIAALVRSAVGYDKTRGDQVHVANLQFADTAGGAGIGEEGSWYEMGKAEYFRIAELSMVALISLMVLVFVVRPLVRRIITPERPPVPAPALAGPEGGALPPPDAVPAIEGPKISSAAAKALASAKIVGEVQQAAIRDVGDIVQNNPEEAVTIIRNWLQEERQGA